MIKIMFGATENACGRRRFFRDRGVARRVPDVQPHSSRSFADRRSLSGEDGKLEDSKFKVRVECRHGADQASNYSSWGGGGASKPAAPGCDDKYLKISAVANCQNEN